MSKFKGLLDNLGIDEKFNKTIQKDKTFNHVKDNIPQVEDANMMADLLYLPTAKFGYKYLFVIVDLATNEFDMEPIKDKDPETVLKAMKKCFTRSYVKQPEYSLKTDSGSEFKGIFHKYLYDESILHKTSIAHRHNSLSNVESLNRQLGRLFNGYMNKKEEKTGKVFKNWTEAIPIIRDELNEIRRVKLSKDPTKVVYSVPIDYTEVKREVVTINKKGKKEIKTETVNVPIKPKFKVGQYVYRYLDAPKDALGKNQTTKNVRMGDYVWDRTQREILQIFTMGNSTGGPLYRYYLDGLPNVSYTEKQLKRAPEPND